MRTRQTSSTTQLKLKNTRSPSSMFDAVVAEERRLHPHAVAARAEQLAQDAPALVLLRLRGVAFSAWQRSRARSRAATSSGSSGSYSSPASIFSRSDKGWLKWCTFCMLVMDKPARHRPGLARQVRNCAAQRPTALDCARCFDPDCHWRDLLAFTWDIRTVSGVEAVVSSLQQHAASTQAHDFRIDPQRTPPRETTARGQNNASRPSSAFESADGTGRRRGAPFPGHAESLDAVDRALSELEGHEEQVGRLRPKGQAYSRDFSGPNWLDRRKAGSEYRDRDPAVLVVGGGHAGLSIAARLTQRGIDMLIVDRGERVGDNWRKRYHALTLHNQVYVNHLPYMPFPPNWPVYIPKDKLANWFESYAEAMELNYWTGNRVPGRYLR